MIKNRLREIRKQRGLTLRQLAGLCKLNPKTGARTIQRLEVYESNLNSKWLEILSKALDVRPTDLIGDGEIGADDDALEGTLKTLFEIVTRKARAFPSVPEAVAAHIALSMYTSVKEGRISGPKGAEKLIDRILENEIARLFEYEAGKVAL
jgi:transcriptional regulator with XRE-family HTH domain